MNRRWLKSLTPRSLIGRTVVILLVPIITIQLVVSYVFIQRLYEKVTIQMTGSLVPSIQYVADRIAAAPSRDGIPEAIGAMSRALQVNVTLDDVAAIEERRLVYDLSGRVVASALREAFPGIGAIDLETNDRRVRFALDTPHGPVVVGFSRNRASASNPHQLLVLMVLVSIVVTLISFLFLKNQVRPIRRLADAASAFGRGQSMQYRPGGATEVRQAGAAFLEMRARIERNIEQRTLLLSGVSHDLRTPLTRMKLALSMRSDDPETRDMMRDVDDMQRMLNTFLGFAQLDATEEAVPADVVALVRGLVEKTRRSGAEVELVVEAGVDIAEIRPVAIERAMENLIGNAIRYGKKARVSVAQTDRTVRLTVEDDGPGIPEDQREEAVRPFARLDPSRNLDRGGSVGLGLSIVRDIARQHGGALRLGESADLGGLRVDLLLAK